MELHRGPRDACLAGLHSLGEDRFSTSAGVVLSTENEKRPRTRVGAGPSRILRKSPTPNAPEPGDERDSEPHPRRPLPNPGVA